MIFTVPIVVTINILNAQTVTILLTNICRTAKSADILKSHLPYEEFDFVFDWGCFHVLFPEKKLRREMTLRFCYALGTTSRY